MPIQGFQVDRSSPLTPIEQLKARLRVAIRTGELRPTAVLPRMRTLAAQLGLNANTVAAAYRDLAREGLVVSRGKGGTRVAPGPFLPTHGPGELLGAIDRLITSAQRIGSSNGDVLRWVAGRWHAPVTARREVATGRRSVYELLRESDHDQA